jgi:hypothetical protein
MRVLIRRLTDSPDVHRNDTALFLSPFAAPILLVVVRLVGGLVASQLSVVSVAAWAVIEAFSSGGIWVVVGWPLNWAAWRLGLGRSVSRSVLTLALLALLFAFVVALNGRAFSAEAPVSLPFESIAIALGALLNLGLFVLLQYAPKPSFKRTPDGAA